MNEPPQRRCAERFRTTHCPVAVNWLLLALTAVRIDGDKQIAKFFEFACIEFGAHSRS
jgi:uncharacterized membrane protein YhdT